VHAAPPMSSVTSINSHRTRPESELDEICGATHLGVGDLIALMDDHTRKLLTRVRLERRGWLVPRSLLAADLLGLSLAYVLTTLMWGEAGAFSSFHQILVFLCTLPCRALLAKLHGLYRSDQEQADHSTTDDVVGVFHLVTIGVWVLLVATRVGGRPYRSIYALITFWSSGCSPSPYCPSPAQARARGCRDPVRRSAAAHQSRPAAPADQRPEGRHVAGRSAALHPV
jgi:hypothetical protein